MIRKPVRLGDQDMAGFRSWCRRLLRRKHEKAQSLPDEGEVIDTTELFEEENLPHYAADQFFPVRIGDVFNRRYQVLGKLDYGGNSTIWFARDLRERRYVTLKVCTGTVSTTHGVVRELKAYEHMAETLPTSSNAGAGRIRPLLDTFELAGPHRQHIALVHDPLSMNLAQLQLRLSPPRFSEDMLKVILIHTLRALDCLHTDAHIIHTDVKMDNILFDLNDASIFEDFAQSLAQAPSARKLVGDRCIYESHQSARDCLAKGLNLPILADFGEARIGDVQEPATIQPQPFRAPEVVLGMHWSYPVDIWMLGCVIWNLFYDKPLFCDDEGANAMSEAWHLAQMVAYLGPPPVYMPQNEKFLLYWGEQGNWKGAGGVSIPALSLEASEENPEGETKNSFLGFVRSMLCWRPEQRKTAAELLNDPWLCSPLSS